MNEKTFAEKYRDAIMGIFEAGGKVDETFICKAKLVSSVKGHFGEEFVDGDGRHVWEVYPGIPKGFPWEEAYEDIKEMEQA